MRTPCTISGTPSLAESGSSRRVAPAQERRGERPDERAGQYLHPPQRPGERVPGPAIDCEHHKLIDKKLAHDDEGLLEDGLRADFLVLAHRDIRHECESQSVLTEHRALEHIKRQA